MSPSLVLATTNRGKLAELLPLVAAHGWEALSLADFPGVPVATELGESFLDNARAKAEYYAHHLQRPVLADDSGLSVAALGGAPGVHSARFAGPAASDAENRAKLLSALKDRPDRRAEFDCVLCLWVPGHQPLVVSGRCHGTIAREEAGAHGFGYDSLFVPDDPAAAGRTFAQLPPGDKARLSHRGAALARLSEALGSFLAALGAAAPGPAASRAPPAAPGGGPAP